MIRLKRGAEPAYLKKNWRSETELLWKDFRAKKPLNVKNSVYAHPTVKKAVRDQQKNKCAYCETLNPRSHDVVEHIRPKAGWRQNASDKLSRPQYFWLSYKWENLLFACDVCNDGGHKQNLFPLIDQSKRATPGKPTIKHEKPLLLNPYTDYPNRHIRWNSDIPSPHRGSQRGATTITVFGLDKDPLLLDARRGHLNLIRATIETAEGLPKSDPRRQQAKTILMEQIADSAQWTAMVKSAFLQRITAL